METWVDLTRQQAFVALRFDDRGWQRLDRLLRPDETGMLLWWDGPAGSRSTSDSTEASLPAELELQLRALGYLQ